MTVWEAIKISAAILGGCFFVGVGVALLVLPGMILFRAFGFQ